MTEEEKTNDEQQQGEVSTDGPGSVSVDEPTDPALSGTDESGFSDDAPKPADPKSE